MSEVVEYRVDDHVATIAMNRPHRRNAFNSALGDELLAAFERAESDRDVRAIVLTGNGGNFSVGRDNSDSAAAKNVPLGRNPRKDRALLMRFTRLVTFMYEMNTPTIAEIHGGCAGAGMSLALGCDFRYAATDAVMSTAFINVAFSGDMGMSWHLTRIVGSTKAMELMMLSPKLRGRDLLEQGLVNGVEPPEDLPAKVRAVASQLARSAPTAMAHLRRNLLAARTLSLGDYMPIEGDRLMACAASPDIEEARRAFVDKRPPRYA
jgi:2-(1,2-epoxy-1,2-dihydrophenyl)acetyl-CoA isomerase